MPRVTDGMICLSVEGNVTYASPNATTCFHRLGIKGSLDKVQLLEQVTNLIPPHSHVDETMSLVLMGRQAWLTELELGGSVLGGALCAAARRWPAGWGDCCWYVTSPSCVVENRCC